MTIATLALASAATASSSDSIDELSGLVGVAARVIASLGEVGVGLLTLIETVFPPIPSELVLPLAGFLAHQGRMNLVLVVVTATLGAYLGGLVLYALGHRIGTERSIRLLSKLPLVDREDFEKAVGWFRRHGTWAVLVGRLIPGVRSLISLPAGAERMNLLVFSGLTIFGSGVWNGLLIGLGAALGTQYDLVDQYAGVLDAIIYSAIGVLLLALVVRSVRRHRAAAHTGSRR
ncbi:DedA family protein [Rathayibacter tritici]|uniref:Alanine dehydrogenase n=1 Tax=Rathayibacter tritici TaxID=33888 RepID=A0A169C2K4_9MICO|nr:DedA family protein [Rathayibacter tritici]AND17151.1 alanine dehydrogenase [Rathayibacter tritici]PPF30656.1 DedA family protein [Rathayibacter tritici]PPF70813.1 DedA family protein [Rathayibacter tritici]PPG08821.1 DedA family protein [Rathayibacter tritici]PPI14875.1 DedA family protein [Rathayibacter tritici]